MFTVQSYDNFGDLEESYRYPERHGAFQTLEQALAKARAVTDDWISECIARQRSVAHLVLQYRCHGERISIFDNGVSVPGAFDTEAYVRRRGEEIFGVKENPPPRRS